MATIIVRHRHSSSSALTSSDLSNGEVGLNTAAAADRADMFIRSDGGTVVKLTNDGPQGIPGIKGPNGGPCPPPSHGGA